MDRRFTALKFNEGLPLVARKHLMLNGQKVKPGQPLPKGLSLRTRQSLWLSRRADYAESYSPTPVEDTGVTMDAAGGGWYVLTAEGQEPVRVQGKEAAEAAYARLAAEIRHEREKAATATVDGPAKVVGGQGGWYEIVGEGVTTEKVRGEEAAVARAAEINAAIAAGQQVQSDGEGDGDGDPDDEADASDIVIPGETVEDDES